MESGSLLGGREGRLKGGRSHDWPPYKNLLTRLAEKLTGETACHTCWREHI